MWSSLPPLLSTIQTLIFHPHILLSHILLLHIPNADYYLLFLILVLILLAFVQLHAFTRPPPVPTKLLPRRPALQILFKPDEEVPPTSRGGKVGGRFGFERSSSSASTLTQSGFGGGGNRDVNTNTPNAFLSTVTEAAPTTDATARSIASNNSSVSAAAAAAAPSSPLLRSNRSRWDGLPRAVPTDTSSSTDDQSLPPPPPPPSSISSSTSSSTKTGKRFLPGDLPDSFAPLLSSSQTEILTNGLTADLIHAVHVEGGLRVKYGRHEIPLDKDSSRPQLVLDVKSPTGCRITTLAHIGSDGFTTTQDLNPTLPTPTRSRPLIKHAGLILDPPLALSNVAPTLIHFPTLFEDNFIPTLRRIQIVRYAFDFIISISSFLERCLWILESKCQIHLSKIRIMPLYKGTKKKQQQEPQWQLNLAFSGYVLLFNFLPIPFINVVLPTFIIPQPHALLEYLLSSQPLASARLKREHIAEEKIVVAMLNTVDCWNLEIKSVATPPALGVDWTLPGGLALAFEMMLGRDVSGTRGSSGQEAQRQQGGGGGYEDLEDDDTLSSWNTGTTSTLRNRYRSNNPNAQQAASSNRDSQQSQQQAFDANTLVPWRLDADLDGYIGEDKITINFNQILASHNTDNDGMDNDNGSQISIRGNIDICKTSTTTSMNDGISENVISPSASGDSVDSLTPPVRSSSPIVRQRSSSSNLPSVVNTTTSTITTTTTATPSPNTESSSPSVCALLLFPSSTSFSSSSTTIPSSSNPYTTKHHRRCGSNKSTSSNKTSDSLLYDYQFDIAEDTHIDAASLSIGASHPMLKGGTIITTILESIYAYGSLTAREGAVLDPHRVAKKRNILRHLPAVDFTTGISNFFIPQQEFVESYHDDGQTKIVPELSGGQMMIRIVGGFMNVGEELEEANNDFLSSPSRQQQQLPTQQEDGLAENKDTSSIFIPPDGIKLIADFGAASFALRNETQVKEFAELDIFEGSKLNSLLAGTFNGRVSAHLRPQPNLPSSMSLVAGGPNIINPLEAYEIDFTGSSVFLKIKESLTTLGHRRIIMPTETTFEVKVVESVVDMALEGRTECEFGWDFQGSSPILQVCPVGQCPANTSHEHKKQAALLISPLRQGRLNLAVSSVGGISIKKAAISRDDREGLYSWKFFHALISPDEDSAKHIMEVIHDKRTMSTVVQVVTLINEELGKILNYVLTQVWRAKEIFDQEGVSDAAKAIPGHKMARLVSLFLCGDVSQVDNILPIIRRVTAGEGLDLVRTKELLREHVEAYETWAPEIDRAVRWAEVMLGPMAAPAPYVEKGVPPLSELPCFAKQFAQIPSAKELYDILLDRRQLPLDPYFSSLVSTIAPYMSFRQIEYVLRVRKSSDWQPDDLRRLRYVYSVKKKVLEISESYGGITFLPQSYLVGVFVGEATRASLRAWGGHLPQKQLQHQQQQFLQQGFSRTTKRRTTLATLRGRRMLAPQASAVSDSVSDDFILSPAGRVASQTDFLKQEKQAREKIHREKNMKQNFYSEDAAPMEINIMNRYDLGDELGDSLLGPQDVAILLQAGLTSSMKGSTVVQLNQRMLLDLMASQPKSFAVAVLAEIGTPGGQGSSRGLASALMALLELDQSSFIRAHRLDMHALLESWLPGLKIPRREDYLAGGRWARQSFYEAIFGVAKSILEDAERYMALKGRIQRVRHNAETDPIPCPKESASLNDDASVEVDIDRPSTPIFSMRAPAKLSEATKKAQDLIASADRQGEAAISDLKKSHRSTTESDLCKVAASVYQNAFDACASVVKLDPLSFQADWFKRFYRRNYDALMVKSIYDNIVEDVDNVRFWMDALRRGAMQGEHDEFHLLGNKLKKFASPSSRLLNRLSFIEDPKIGMEEDEDSLPTYFAEPEKHSEQELIDAIIEAVFFNIDEREQLKKDPLVRLLVSNRPGHYNFTIITAMGVITEGKRGTELEAAFKRLEKERGVTTIRADTGTARSFEFNASKIEEAIVAAVKLKKPFGLLGYSQGCANILMCESLLRSGTPLQQSFLSTPNSGLICRQLLFSAANGSVHGPASNAKIQRLIVMCEDFFKYQQGYFSRAFITFFLELLNDLMDSAPFQNFVGGAQSFLPEGSKAFWREGQHLPHVPTCVLRGVMEEHTTPESLEMISNLLTKQSGSALHDSQVHVYDAVGHPVSTKNRNGKILENCDMGGAVQRCHHWSPLDEEVAFLKTKRDALQGSFDCAKDRHVYPWVDVNARFGFIQYAPEEKKQGN